MSVVRCRSAADDDLKKLSYEDLQTIAEFIRGKTDIKPEIGIICGSGLGGLAENLDADRPKVVISYTDIPKFPKCLGIIILCCTDMYRGLGVGVHSSSCIENMCVHYLCGYIVTVSLLFSVKGHAGNLVFGYLSGQPVVCMQGRFHFYEGHPPWKVWACVHLLVAKLILHGRYGHVCTY